MEERVSAEVKAREERVGEPFFPHHLLDRTIVMLVVVAAIISLATFYPAAIEERADPYASPGRVKPEWYFLAIYQVLKLADNLAFLGKWVPRFIGVYGVAAAFLLVLLWPWIERSKERHPLKKPAITAIEVAAVFALVALTIWGYYS